MYVNKDINTWTNVMTVGETRELPNSGMSTQLWASAVCYADPDVTIDWYKVIDCGIITYEVTERHAKVGKDVLNRRTHSNEEDACQDYLIRAFNVSL